MKALYTAKLKALIQIAVISWAYYIYMESNPGYL